uniref:Podocin n=1 Tax=Lates calcarifer TaxID=8187 RepID=A0A4W6CMY3_LATCA
MEKSSDVHPSHMPGSSVTSRKKSKRGDMVPNRSHRQTGSKAVRLSAFTSQPSLSAIWTITVFYSNGLIDASVIFRLGHLLRGRPRGPGLLFYLPLLDVCHKVDIRLKMLKVPLHTVVTKDLVRPELSAVCYYQIENVALCSTALFSLSTVLQSLVQAAVRDVLAQHTFNHILLHRRRIGQQIQAAVDSVACRWGIRVERADIDELSFPVELQQSLAAEAEVKRQQARVSNHTSFL